MDYLTAVHTDVGIKKQTNQDAALIMTADTKKGKILLSVICDGMGGLAKGEVASSALVREFSDWFQETLPQMLEKNIFPEKLCDSWSELVFHMNLKISEYGVLNRLSLGTTAAALLLWGNNYYILNIGDSRVYRIKSDLIQLTKDQTYIQREMDAGRMSAEEAMSDPKRNVLLQCVGASTVISPDFYSGSFEPNTMFMMCSDGFRHLIEERELYEYFNPYVLKNEIQMSENEKYLTELNKHRKETDNITVSLIKVC